MNARTGHAYPFLVLSADCINETKLLLGRKGDPLSAVGEVFEDWDYNTDLSVLAAIDLDWDAAMAKLECDPDLTTLSCVLSIGTGQGRNPRIRWTAARETLSAAKSHCQIVHDIRGLDLSGSLHLQFSLLLADSSGVVSDFAPIKAGSRLWTLEHSVLLEGGGDARFPLESLSFSSSPHLGNYSSAPWYVQWSDGPLQADYSAAVRLLVNTDCTDWYERILDGDPLILQAMVADVALLLCTHTVTEAETEEARSCESGSVGHQIGIWLEQAFGSLGHQTLQQLLEIDPAGFRASILAACELRKSA